MYVCLCGIEKAWILSINLISKLNLTYFSLVRCELTWNNNKMNLLSERLSERKTRKRRRERERSSLSSLCFLLGNRASTVFLRSNLAWEEDTCAHSRARTVSSSDDGKVLFIALLLRFSSTSFVVVVLRMKIVDKF